eukprot:4826291-Prymnesium_polylepis.1
MEPAVSADVRFAASARTGPPTFRPSQTARVHACASRGRVSGSTEALSQVCAACLEHDQGLPGPCGVTNPGYWLVTSRSGECLCGAHAQLLRCLPFALPAFA